MYHAVYQILLERPMEITTLELPGIQKVRSGKVREIFDLGKDGLLFVATDRISAFDCILSDPIPGKGRILTQLSAWWFQGLREFTAMLKEGAQMRNHLVTADFAQFPERLQPFKAQLEGRSMIVLRTRPLPVECIVRGYLAGQGWKEYQARGSVCGVQLPAGLRLGDRIPEPFFPLFTPAKKSDTGHDENVNWETFVEVLGNEAMATILKAASQLFYLYGARIAEERGIVIADTKFEFGVDDANGEILLIDECLTPDSSRFWPASGWEFGANPPSFDKQFVRDYLEKSIWNKLPPAPHLPEDIIQQTSQKYLQAYQMITGQSP